ncbi:MAG TPA: hypothetical protein PLI13_04570 [Paracoccus sp. (in: a-proteobacteria)]|nr:hypothetical protein [Paracoccus sp. (in: a-proteobacteria)]
MQQHDPQDESRKLRFEARKFALETLAKMYLVQAEATRNLRVGHVKLTFGLSLGALAGFLTVISALARFVADFPTWPADMGGILVLGFGLGVLLLAAIVAISQYRATVERTADLLLHPYPKAEAEFQAILQDHSLDETGYLDKLSTILRTRTEDARQHQAPSSLVLVLILIGAMVTSIALFIL